MPFGSLTLAERAALGRMGERVREAVEAFGQVLEGVRTASAGVAALAACLGHEDGEALAALEVLDEAGRLQVAAAAVQLAELATAPPPVPR
jgi:hypothetical protein